MLLYELPSAKISGDDDGRPCCTLQVLTRRGFRAFSSIRETTLPALLLPYWRLLLIPHNRTVGSLGGSSGESQPDETKAITKVDSKYPILSLWVIDTRNIQVDQLMEAVQSNMAGELFAYPWDSCSSDAMLPYVACHLKTENYQRALYYAEKVCLLNFLRLLSPFADINTSCTM